MALVLADRVQETTTTTGTGTVTLLGAVTGYQSFAVIGNANTTYYCIASQTGSQWEVGIGTYTSAGTTLARTTVLASSNAGSAVTFSAGTKNVFVTYPAGYTVNTQTGSAAFLSGYTATAFNPTWGSSVLTVTAAGVVEAGRYIDFHGASAEVPDYTVRLDGGGAGSTTLGLTGNFTASGTIAASSDERIKTNWRDLPADFVAQLSGVKHGTYDRLDAAVTQDGVSAQSLQPLLPHSVLEGADGNLSVAYGNAALVSAIELAKLAVAQEARIAALEAAVAQLMKR